MMGELLNKFLRIDAIIAMAMRAPPLIWIRFAGISPSAAPTPPKNKNSPRKYVRTIAAPPTPTPTKSRHSSLRLRLRGSATNPTSRPSSPFAIRVKGAKAKYPKKTSPNMEPIAPAKRPTHGPNNNPAIMTPASPKLKYPPVAGMGIMKTVVKRVVRVAKIAQMDTNRGLLEIAYPKMPWWVFTCAITHINDCFLEGFPRFTLQYVGVVLIFASKKE